MQNGYFWSRFMYGAKTIERKTEVGEVSDESLMDTRTGLGVDEIHMLMSFD